MSIIIFLILKFNININQGIDNITQNVNNNNNKSNNSSLVTKNKVIIPKFIEDNKIGFLIGDSKESSLVAKIGAGWVRPHPGPFIWGWIEAEEGNYDFNETDLWVRNIQDNNISILATIFPFADWDQFNCHSKECYVNNYDIFYPRKIFGTNNYRGIPKSRCVPCNMSNYKLFLLKLVERYDGDGVNDMPGLKIPIKYWEILNEPDLKENDLTFFKGSKQEYVNILNISYEAIKQACPDCKIVQGGSMGVPPEESNSSYWSEIIKLGGADYFDIENVHFINQEDLQTLNAKWFKGLFLKNNISKPLWITEAQFNSKEDIIDAVKGAFNEGVSKIFFTDFIIGHHGMSINGNYEIVYDEIIKEYIK